MTNTYLLIALCILNAGVLIAWFFRRRAADDSETLRPLFENLLAEIRRVETSLRDEFSRQRTDSGREAQALREEVNNRISGGLDTLLKRQADAQRTNEDRLESFRLTLENQLRTFGEASDTRLARLRQELNENSARLAEILGQQFDRIRLTVEGKLTELQNKNEQKLDEMRKTVDEKLEGTLERRLGESFKLVSERLEQVHKGLGEMQNMASSVGDLKRVLTNVKTRGTWGEIQLGALLEQVLSPEQYGSNVAPRPNSSERVDFAIRLPGAKNGAGDTPLWLPIDAKFPQEDYQRLLEASETADADALATASKGLETQLRLQAKIIREKYICPPHTTDFAILFLPSEGLYAEVLRRPGLTERLQVENRVVIAGPTTLAALLNSLQMGFKTLAIQRRSSEVWRLLAEVKGEFGKFGDVLAKVKRKIDEASNQIEETERRTRVINRTLRNVEALPPDQAPQLLSAAADIAGDEPVEDAVLGLGDDLPLLTRRNEVDK
jgi:DNA recombination protein RmuC